MSLVSGSKQHQGVKRTMLKMNTRATHQRFLMGKIQIFLSASGVHFSCLLLSTVKQQFQEHRVWLGRWKKGTFYSLQLQFHHSVWIPVAQCVHTMAFDTIAGCHRCARPSWSNLSIWQVATSKKKTCQPAWVLWNISLDFANTLQEYHFISRRRAVSALALQTYSRKMFGTQKPTTSVSDSACNCRVR